MDLKYSLDVNLTKADIEAIISDYITNEMPTFKVESISFTLTDNSNPQDRFSTYTMSGAKVKLSPIKPGEFNS